MDPVLFSAYGAIDIALLAWGIALAARHGWGTPANLPLLVLVGLAYDNLIVASGGLIGEGPVLELLNAARFWLHAFLTPSLVVWAWHAVRRAGVPWARSSAAPIVAVTAAAALIVLELATGVAGLELEPQREYGVLSYRDAAPTGGPPLMVLFVAGALIAAGVLVWRRQHWPWLLLGSLAMTAGSAVEIPVPSAAAVNLFEVALLVAIIATKARQDRDDRRRGGITSRRGSPPRSERRPR